MQQQNILCFTMRNMFICITWVLLLLLVVISLPASVRCANIQQNNNNNSSKSSSSNNININHNSTSNNSSSSSGNNVHENNTIASSVASVATTTTDDANNNINNTNYYLYNVGINEAEHECDSLHIMNVYDNLLHLTGCTVIRGSLTIVLLSNIDAAVAAAATAAATVAANDSSTNSNNSTHKKIPAQADTCDFERYQFPLLREITEYIFFYQLKGLRSFKRLFPNLTVIRGQRLFLHYALSIYSMPDLERLEFPALLSIQYGDVFISATPKLCQIDQIDWANLTIQPEQNYIFPMNAPNETCPLIDRHQQCSKCHSNSCWSSDVCQLIEETAVSSAAPHSHCRDDCLGGCRSGTQDCMVCRHLTAHGKCVDTCPPNTYLMEYMQRCLTHAECAEWKHFINDTNCLPTCPVGYMMNTTTYECVICPPGDNCIKVCQPTETAFHLFTVFTMRDAEHLQGCHTLNGSLMIIIRTPINETKLQQRFADVREVTGHVKIADSTYLTSLDFLSGLRRIAGKPLENKMHSLIVYGNTRLRRLWHIKEGDAEQLRLEAGGIYVHNNHLLCNTELYEFRELVVHNRAHDSLQLNDEAVLCTPLLIDAQLAVLSHTALRISWPTLGSGAHLRVLWHAVPHGINDTQAIRQLTEEDDEQICSGGYWQRRELLLNELSSNGTHYNYTIQPLQAYTRYLVLLRMFGDVCDSHTSVDSGNVVTLPEVRREVRSKPLMAITRANVPTTPALRVVAKTNVSLTVHVLPQNRSYEPIAYYKLYVYEVPAAVLDNRNYCNQPPLVIGEQGSAYDGSRNVDYDDCCTRRVEAVEEAAFNAAMHEDYSCSMDRLRNCNNNKLSTMPSALNSSSSNGIKLYTNIILHSLKYSLTTLRSYTQYVFMLQACMLLNDGNGSRSGYNSNSSEVCGAYSLHSEHTNYTEAADHLVDLRACWSAQDQRYFVHFSEPVHPNGLILYYMLHLRSEILPNGEHEIHTECITRQEHRANHYQFAMQRLNYSFHDVSVRVYSLANNVWSPIVAFDACDNDFDVVSINLAGTAPHKHGFNVFLVCFLLGAGGTLLWVCYKRRYWRKCSNLRNLLPHARFCNWRMPITQRHNATDMEDRMILVEDFETVRFHNSDDDEHTYLE